jgi:hypothetical protein
MRKRVMTIVLGFFVGLLPSLVLASPLTPAKYQMQFKPLKIQPLQVIPTPQAVQEVGGIQYGRHLDLKLRDGTTVRCFPAATRDPAQAGKNYYYLPANPRVAKHADGTPKFSMIRFVTDKTKEAGGAEGAILHFLVEYGLTQAQQDEVGKLLAQKDKGAKLKGAVPLEVGAEGNSFHVISAVLGDQGFTSTLITSGKAPVMEGQAVAVAARLDAYGATLLAKSLEQPTTDISVVFDLKYVVKLPAYDVRVVIDYDMYHKMENEYVQSRDKTTKRTRYWDPKWYNPFNIGTSKTTTLTETEQREMIDFLQETGMVTFDYVQHVPDADKEIVESGLHKLVLESFFDMQNRLGQPSDEEIIGADPDEMDKETAEARRKEAAKVKPLPLHRFPEEGDYPQIQTSAFAQESDRPLRTAHHDGQCGGLVRTVQKQSKGGGRGQPGRPLFPAPGNALCDRQRGLRYF